MERKTDIKIFAEQIEEAATAQIERIAAMDAFKGAKIRIMPDVHAGAGCVCGFTANLGEKVVPNLIGVDIGCGMLTAVLGAIDIDCARLDAVIRQFVPFGLSVHEKPVDVSAYRAYDCNPRDCKVEFAPGRYDRFDRSIGSLGGGNHFIEIDVGQDGCKYLVVHCGSRNFGKCVCDAWQDRAVREMEGRVIPLSDMIAEAKASCKDVREIQGAINRARERYQAMRAKEFVDKDLAWLAGDLREAYVHDMKIAQRWAVLNRETIVQVICREMGWTPKATFSTVHNYLGEDNVIRKSAISAKKGERVLIPLNMRDGSILAVGKGNEDWNNSAPHGAGRLMSRTAARSQVSVDEFKRTMEGVWTTCVGADTVDESPFAYKGSESIIRQIGETVDVLEVVKPLYNFKASE